MLLLNKSLLDQAFCQLSRRRSLFFPALTCGSDSEASPERWIFGYGTHKNGGLATLATNEQWSKPTKPIPSTHSIFIYTYMNGCFFHGIWTQKASNETNFSGRFKTKKHRTSMDFWILFSAVVYFETPEEILEKITDMFGDLWGDTCRNGLA